MTGSTFRLALVAAATATATVLAGLAPAAGAEGATVPGAAAAAPAGTRVLVPRAAVPVSRLRVTAIPVVTGLVEPTGMATSPDGRIFVVERRGTVRVVSGGRIRPGFYADLRGRVETSGGEQGLLGIALDPNFPRVPRLWVTYTAKGGGSYSGALTLARLRAATPTAPQAAPSSFRVVKVVRHGQAQNHNGGSIVFGKDGMLFWGTGDGGGGGDGFDNARRGTRLLGKVLRLDVRRSCSGLRYCYPRSNPRYAQGRRDLAGAVWLKGVRNPWRMSVDPRTGDLWIGDVGQDTWEEIDRVPAGRGGLDLGWPCREGKHSFDPARCGGRTMAAPVLEICHPDGVPGCTDAVGGESITGGIVYRGTKQPAMTGAYLFADFVTGNIWAYRGGRYARVGTYGYLSSFGVTSQGEPLALSYGGTLVRLVASTV